MTCAKCSKPGATFRWVDPDGLTWWWHPFCWEQARKQLQ